MSRLVEQEGKELASGNGYFHPYRHPGSGSGGYTFTVLRYAASRLFDLHLPLTITDDSRVLARQLGNRDLQVCNSGRIF